MKIQNDDEARLRILKAAVIEFSEKGYEKGSTNTIAKKANSAKGLIFKYYKDKLTLYLAAIDYALARYTELYTFENLGLPPEKDIIKRISQSTAIKLKLFRTEPVCSELIVKSYLSQNEAVREHINNKIAAIVPGIMDMLFNDLDFSRFRSDMTREQIIGFIALYSKVLEEKYRNSFTQFKDFEELALTLSDSIYKDFDILLNGLYKR